MLGSIFSHSVDCNTMHVSSLFLFFFPPFCDYACTPSIPKKTWHLGQRHGLQNTTLTSYSSKNIYQKVIYVYFHKSIFQDKSIHIIFTFSNSTTWELFMIYILKVWLKPCPKCQLFWVWRECMLLKHASQNETNCVTLI